MKIRIIGFSYRRIVKPLLFKFDPEFVHDRFTVTGKLLGKFKITRLIIRKLFNYENKMLEQNILGLEFRNPVGLSAGFDKNAKLLKILPEVGFGHMEIGSVTLNQYDGNPKPRLYRLKKSKGLVVYYGLMNEGVKKIANKIKNYGKLNSVVGISVAKTNCKETATEEAGIEDYFECLKYLVNENVGDYYTINISCPNTFGGEPFTTKSKLENLLSKLTEVKTDKPVFIKMPINLPIEEFDKLLEIIVKYKIPGVIIGNLTKDRTSIHIKDEIPDNIKGGISGKPTFELSNQLISHTYKKYGDKLMIVGVGGIFSAEDAYVKIKKGASLLQLITGMIFQGPQLIGEINRGLTDLLKNDGYKNLSDAIGTEA